jgi:triphosphatase
MDAAVRFPTSPKAVKAVPITLSKRMNAEQAFQVIVRNCIDQVQRNEAGVARYHDAESLHQMRVGLRRLKAAFSLFGDLLQVPSGIADERKWLTDQLGPARDLDVLIASTLPRVAGALSGPAELDSVRAAAREKSEALFEQAGAAVSSDRYGKLVSSLEQWVEQRGWRDDIPAKGRLRLKLRVTDLASTILEQEQRRLLKRGSKLKDADATQRHRVRIAAKRTRYATEFFASLYRGKMVHRYVRSLARLQDELGWMNDAVVGGELLAELAEGGTDVKEGACLARGFLAACVGMESAVVRTSWKRFALAKLPN